MRVASAPEIAYLQKAGIVSKSARQLNLVSITFAAAALAEVLPAPFIAALRAARNRPQGEQAGTASVLQAGVASSCPVSAMPAHVGPPCPLEVEELQQGYLLPETAIVGLVKVQLDEYCLWETEDVNLMRDGKACADSRKSRNGVRDYLGFLRKHKQLQPDLELYVQGHLIMEYLCFKRARGCEVSTQVVNLKCVKKLVIWMCSKRAQEEWFPELQRLRDDLSNLIRQVCAKQRIHYFPLETS